MNYFEFLGCREERKIAEEIETTPMVANKPSDSLSMSAARTRPVRSSSNSKVADCEALVDFSPFRYREIASTVHAIPRYAIEAQPAAPIFSRVRFSPPNESATGARKVVMEITIAKALPTDTALSRLLSTMKRV